MLKHVPQDKRRMETKKKIVDAAMLLFSTKGYYQTNSKEIVKDAGVSIGSFYTYFEDKKALLIDILNTYIQEALPITWEQNYSSSICSHDRKVILKNLIENCFDSHHFTLGFYQQVTMLSTVDEEIGRVFKEYQNTILFRIKDILLSFEPNLPADCQKAACIILYAAIEGSIHSVKFSKPDIEASLLINELIRFLDSYLSALQAADDLNQ